MSKEVRDKTKLTYKFMVEECDHKTLDKVLFIRNRIISDLLFKTIQQASKNKSNNLQPGGGSLKGDHQAAGYKTG